MYILDDTLLVIFESHIWGKLEVNSSRIRTEYGEIVRMRENTDQKSSEYGHFSSSEDSWLLICFINEYSKIKIVKEFGARNCKNQLLSVRIIQC